jgi:hypothetical protein
MAWLFLVKFDANWVTPAVQASQDSVSLWGTIRYFMAAFFGGAEVTRVIHVAPAGLCDGAGDFVHGLMPVATTCRPFGAANGAGAMRRKHPRSSGLWVVRRLWLELRWDSGCGAGELAASVLSG